METKKKKIGFILNPYAGIGGKAGLKGSDNYKKIEKLLLEGCERTAPKRAESCMSKIAYFTASLVAGDKGSVGEKNFSILSAPGDMGEALLKKLKIPCDVVLCPKADTSSAEDTKLCAQIMKEQGVDLLVFCGGDGTARDICEVVGTDVTVLGIPSGVKMYSACYACNPYQAGEMLAGWLEGKEMSYEMREVLDIEEKDLDSRNVSPKLYGFLKVLSDGKHLQKAKELDLGSGESATIIEGSNLANGKGLGLYYRPGRNDLEDKRVIV